MDEIGETLLITSSNSSAFLPSSMWLEDEVLIKPQKEGESYWFKYHSDKYLGQLNGPGVGSIYVSTKDFRKLEKRLVEFNSSLQVTTERNKTVIDTRVYFLVQNEEVGNFKESKNTSL